MVYGSHSFTVFFSASYVWLPKSYQQHAARMIQQRFLEIKLRQRLHFSFSLALLT